jgi:hypothetical protein
MHQSRSVEGVAGTLTMHLPVGHTLQLVVDEREQAIEGLGVPRRELLQERCDVRVCPA